MPGTPATTTSDGRPAAASVHARSRRVSSSWRPTRAPARGVGAAAVGASIRFAAQNGEVETLGLRVRVGAELVGEPGSERGVQLQSGASHVRPG